jgi:hypothetical protein
MIPLSFRVLAAACIAASCSAASAQNLAGRYSVDGRNFDGSSYGGTLTIAADGPVFRLTFADGRTQRGMGIQRGNHLVAAFGPRDCIVAAMEKTADGGLRGAWGSLDRSALGTETLQKQAGPAGQPDGTYDANGRSPTGDTYEGVTTITPRGQTYRVVYKDSGSQQSGVAVLQGNVLGVAYGGPECVVSVYAIGADGTLTGRWADPADTRVGQETVKRAR